MRKVTSLNFLNNENINDQINHRQGQIQKLNYDNHNDDNDESIRQEYESLALQLLDLMHTLHTRASQIYKHTIIEETDKKTSSILWYKCWCPILQGWSFFVLIKIQ